MNASILVTSPAVVLLNPPPGPPSGSGVADLLRQLIDVQKDQLAFHKAQAAVAEARWRAFLARWQTDFPDVGHACRQVLPTVERAYLTLVTELADRVKDGDADGLDNEFALAEFLDRYGMRLGQLGTILSQIGPLADAAPPLDDKVAG